MLCVEALQRVLICSRYAINQTAKLVTCWNVAHRGALSRTGIDVQSLRGIQNVDALKPLGMLCVEALHLFLMCSHYQVCDQMSRLVICWDVLRRGVLFLDTEIKASTVRRNR